MDWCFVGRFQDSMKHRISWVLCCVRGSLLTLTMAENGPAIYRA
uniref:Uncharacterized protein n=1 Tax=Rhizophora mucronata TaxID=61149 RepID=A0A2P2QVL1_RHIMU